MDEATSFDLAVLGSTPLARLVAGLVAGRQGRRVCLVAGPATPFRLPRRYDLSLFPVTRPETLRLMLDGAAETERLLRSMGKGLYRRIDPVVVAETSASAAALGHFRHLAGAWGVATEWRADPLGPEARMLRLRDVAILLPYAFDSIADRWLDSLGVTSVDALGAAVTFRRDGGLRIEGGGREITAREAFLADDEAILMHAPKAAVGPLVVQRPTTAILTEPSESPRAVLEVWLDRGVTLMQRGRQGVAALVTGSPASARERLGATLNPADTLRRAGESRFTTLVTADGAPIFGRPAAGRPLLAIGFGPSATAFAPAIARALAGASSNAERTWFAVHGPVRTGSRPTIADYPAFAA